MCLYERDLNLLFMSVALLLAQLCFLFTIPEGRAGLAEIEPRRLWQPLARALVFTLPAAALIKLFHDWVGDSGKSLCMGRLVYLLGCFLLCAVLELQSFASKHVKSDSDLDVATRYAVRWWGLVFVFVALLLALHHFVSFE